VPTLVLHRRNDSQLHAEFGRYLAEEISGASYVELEGDDHLYFLGDSDAIADELEEFLTGSRGAPAPNRKLATVLIVDIVESRYIASQLGDRRWTRLLGSAYTTARRQIERFRGDEVKTTGWSPSSTDRPERRWRRSRSGRPSRASASPSAPAFPRAVAVRSRTSMGSGPSSRSST
jgi:hypothetical protein